MSANQPGELVGLVRLHQVTGGGQQREPGTGDPVGQLGAVRGGQPGVGFAPEEERRRGDLVKQRRDVVGVPRVALRDLSVEG